ncbi:PREDICTED: uncharacterized protein LOC109222521, partial [Nicotiana attenuata]|uniref:uncharacterized protein LOC109222521 n=1 Tax=Nicotiana attenuata TaxID=49451 RepID=UPI00090476A8
VWFYECCTVVDQKFVVRVGDLTPSILNWKMTDRLMHEDFSTGLFNSTGNKFKNISPTIVELRRFTLPVEATDEYQKYLTSSNRGKLPIDDSDDFVTPPPKQIKEPVPPKKAPGVQPVDYDRELQKLKDDVKQLHKQLNSFMKYVSNKFKNVFELINSKLGASKVKYGAHPEEDTSGRQDNNDFVSNMEFGGNEDVEMDGCKVGGSEGKDVPHSQRDTSEYHRNNIMLGATGQLGVNTMEGPSGVKVDMFVAKVTFTLDVAHAGGIGEIADTAAGETKEESKKQKVPESRTGVVCATASVDAAAGETEEESEKQKVPESQTGAICATASVDEAAGEMVLYNHELLLEVSPQMEKRKRCPAKVVQSPFITVFDSGSNTGVVAAKGKKQIYAIKHPFQSKIGTGINNSLLNVFAAWVKEGKNEIYPKHVSELNPAYDLGVFHGEDKKMHIDVLIYYLRKKGKYDKDLPVTFTTTVWYFDQKLNELWQAFIDTDGDSDVRNMKHVIEYIQGFVLDANVPWHTVEHVLMTINVTEQWHWIMVVISFKDRCIYVYDSMRGGAAYQAKVHKTMAKYSVLLPHFFVHTHFYLNKKDINWRTGVYKSKDLITLFAVKLVEGLPQQVEVDCVVFATSFAEYFIEGKTPLKQYNAYAHRRRFGALLWDYARKKMELNAQSDDEIIGLQKKSRKQKKQLLLSLL